MSPSGSLASAMVVASVGADLGHLPGGGPRDRLEVDALAEDVQHAGLDLNGDLLAGIPATDRADLAGDHDDAVGMHQPTNLPRLTGPRPAGAGVGGLVGHQQRRDGWQGRVGCCGEPLGRAGHG
jgi:hypothetical protein